MDNVFIVFGGILAVVSAFSLWQAMALQKTQKSQEAALRQVLSVTNEVHELKKALSSLPGDHLVTPADNYTNASGVLGDGASTRAMWNYAADIKARADGATFATKIGGAVYLDTTHGFSEDAARRNAKEDVDAYLRKVFVDTGMWRGFEIVDVSVQPGL